jgi:hypothetical protein
MRLSSTSIGVVVVMVVAAVAEVIVIGEIDPGALLLVEVAMGLVGRRLFPLLLLLAGFL